jgi:hypothetical protein
MIALSNVAIRWRAEFVALTRRVLLQAEELRAAFMLKKKRSFCSANKYFPRNFSVALH